MFFFSQKLLVIKVIRSDVIIMILILLPRLKGNSKIRDTLQGEGVMRLCHAYFFSFWNTLFKTFRSEKFCLTESLGFKGYFLSYSFCVSKQIVLKTSDQNITHWRWGGQKSPKKCHVLFEWPLSHHSWYTL